MNIISSKLGQARSDLIVYAVGFNRSYTEGNAVNIYILIIQFSFVIDLNLIKKKIKNYFQLNVIQPKYKKHLRVIAEI